MNKIFTSYIMSCGLDKINKLSVQYGGEIPFSSMKQINKSTQKKKKKKKI